MLRNKNFRVRNNTYRHIHCFCLLPTMTQVKIRKLQIDTLMRIDSLLCLLEVSQEKTQCRFHQKVFRKKDWFVVDNVHFQFLSFFKHVIWWKWNSLHISMTMLVLVLAAETHLLRYLRTKSWSLSEKNGISQQAPNKQSYPYISILYIFSQ